RPADHRLLRARGRRKREPRELARGERERRRIDEQRIEGRTPRATPRDLALDPRAQSTSPAKMPIMPTRKNAATLEGNRVHLRPPRRGDETTFIAQALASRRLHRRWVQAPDAPDAFAVYVQRYRRIDPAVRHAGFLVVRNDDEALAGVINFSEIVRGAFLSAYVGY